LSNFNVKKYGFDVFYGFFMGKMVQIHESEQQASIFEDMSKSSGDGTKLSWWVSTLALFAVFLVG
jgi:hypothetical protein